MCVMLLMALKSNEEYPITLWWPLAIGGRWSCQKVQSSGALMFLVRVM
jgi:hypothetical protein